MALTFDQIPSVEEIRNEVPKVAPVAEEIEARQEMLQQRATKCKIIKPLYSSSKKPQHWYFLKMICVCPRYNPTYCCKHAGNVILDRDVLTKEEHICYLATPKGSIAAPRKQPQIYYKRSIRSNCTSRIEKLALPDLKRVKHNLIDYEHILKKKNINSLKKQLKKSTSVVEYTNIKTALNYIDEEKRLKRVQKIMQKRRCQRLKKNILCKQRKQIRKIICVLFEEMKDFLLNDQFLIDERSTLCAVILDQIRVFTDSEFYCTSNLREYQQILANNLTIWINKFISNLNIHLAPPPPKQSRFEPDNFLPVKDYISCSESGCEEYLSEDKDFAWGEVSEYDYAYYHPEVYTDETIVNTNQ